MVLAPLRRGRLWILAAFVAIVAVAVVVVAIVQSEPESGQARVTVSHEAPCSNSSGLRALGTNWTSDELMPVAWGHSQSGILTRRGDHAVFRSDGDGRTMSFDRVKEFTTTVCLKGERP